MEEDAAVDPSGVYAVGIDRDSLFAEGGVVGVELVFYQIIQEGGRVPSGFLFGKGEAGVVLTGVGNNDLVVAVRGDIRKIVATRSVGRDAGGNAGLESGDFNGDVRNV